MIGTAIIMKTKLPQPRIPKSPLSEVSNSNRYQAPTGNQKTDTAAPRDGNVQQAYKNKRPQTLHNANTGSAHRGRNRGHRD